MIGESESCISVSNIRDTDVIDERTIDFRTPGGRIYRNRLANSCPRLESSGFTYTTTISRLCRGEIVYPIERFGGELSRGPGCGLGEFVPIEYADGAVTSLFGQEGADAIAQWRSG